jgi:hypothetical protein
MKTFQRSVRGSNLMLNINANNVEQYRVARIPEAVGLVIAPAQ